MNTNNETDTTKIPVVHEMVRPMLFAAMFDLLDWRGSPERIVSAWQTLGESLDDYEPGEREFADNLGSSVWSDLDHATAVHGLEDRSEIEWYDRYIRLAYAYGAEEWPAAALVDYLRLFEGLDRESAETMARRSWESARLRYATFKSSQFAKAACTTETNI
ncbi:hypothetical protein ROV93_02250 [Stenotrophomonas maltophilia group sp. msm4]|mgnify:CR=1 FL=1|uniref:hypothetical protein n=1 Tax=Stenotrophomonas maltophilia group sp. msm4 TaxID=3061100 RepID=UPI002893B3CD|nr:hypothetical protein [Stenotrophomonas maltophilia group sp. msm4]MDT3489017.1 hypothetical protein [Stenotrophomonas maltophilia group sp. msm4]